jgi:hypothetical protein
VTFQFDKWGGGFVVEVAKGATDGFTTHWGERIAPGKLKANDLHPNERLRLGSNGPKGDHWFRYDAGETVEDVVQAVVACLPQAETWWALAADNKAG